MNCIVTWIKSTMIMINNYRNIVLGIQNWILCWYVKLGKPKLQALLLQLVPLPWLGWIFCALSDHVWVVPWCKDSLVFIFLFEVKNEIFCFHPVISTHIILLLYCLSSLSLIPVYSIMNILWGWWASYHCHFTARSLIINKDQLNCSLDGNPSQSEC